MSACSWSRSARISLWESRKPLFASWGTLTSPFMRSDVVADRLHGLSRVLVGLQPPRAVVVRAVVVQVETAAVVCCRLLGDESYRIHKGTCPGGAAAPFLLQP